MKLNMIISLQLIIMYNYIDFHDNIMFTLNEGQYRIVDVHYA